MDAQTISAITLTTNKTVYTINEVIIISGTVFSLYSGIPIYITIITPNKSPSSIIPIQVNSNKTFSCLLAINSDWVLGDYTIKATYGSETITSQTTITYQNGIIHSTPDLTLEQRVTALEIKYLAQQTHYTKN